MFYTEEQEEEARTPLATPADAIREYAWNAGAMFSNRAWILTDYDVWVKTPHYKGPPVKHPEDDD
jgi:hypothetical protein